MKFKGYIFDFDGTLADSMGVWRDIVVGYLADRGIKLTPQQAVDTMVFMTQNGLGVGIPALFERYGIGEDPLAVAAAWNQQAFEAYATSVELKPYARQLLEQLHGQGAKLSIATAGDVRPLTAALANLGIAPLFDAVIAAAEVTDQGKSVPDVFEEAARRMGVAPAECAVLEDVASNVQVAKAAGFYTVGVKDANPQQDAEALRAVSDMFIESFQELLA